MTVYKHRFYYDNGTESGELATCTDQMTANFLADHYRNVYGNSPGFAVSYKYKRNVKSIVDNRKEGDLK